MIDSKLTYLGPLSKQGEVEPGQARFDLRRLPMGLILFVAVPTLIAAFYFLVLASPRYVSEARFIVRAPSRTQPSSLGMALQGVGISATQTDSFAVHEYIRSRDAVHELIKEMDLKRAYGRAGVDAFSRLPRFWQDGSFDDFYRGFSSYVTVGYDSTTGISTLRVQAFSPDDATMIAQRLLGGGERLVNRLNERAERDSVREAERSAEEARTRLAVAQAQLTAFRNRERFIDPARTAIASTELIGELSIKLATLRAERAQVAAEAPQSPQLPLLDGRIRAFDALIEAERRKIVGDADSLAPKIGTYESLVLNRELADRAMAAATVALDTARRDARRQQLYLERIVDPSQPSEPSQPKRLLSILAVFATCLLAYGASWLIWAGLRESKQH